MINRSSLLLLSKDELKSLLKKTLISILVIIITAIITAIVGTYSFNSTKDIDLTGILYLIGCIGSILPILYLSIKISLWFAVPLGWVNCYLFLKTSSILNPILNQQPEFKLFLSLSLILGIISVLNICYFLYFCYIQLRNEGE